MGVAGGNGCAAGAASGVVGELAGLSLKDNIATGAMSKETAVQLSGLVGAGAALLTSVATGQSDGDSANNIFVGQNIGGNAARNNALYVSKETKDIVANDGENDHKIILIDEAEENKIFSSYMTDLLVTNLASEAIDNPTGVIPVSKNYQTKTDGTSYNLTNEQDFKTLALITGKDGMTYSLETLDLIFNQQLTNDMSTYIFFQSGMNNNYRSAAKSAGLIQDATAQKVGLIVNNTNPKSGIKGDIFEYLPNQLTLKDALNGEAYQQIIKNNPNSKNLVIMHSAGNEDAIKAAKILRMQNVNLDNKIDFISVGSPVSVKQLQTALRPIGGNLIGQYNNWSDPITNSKTWVAGTLALFGAGLTYIYYRHCHRLYWN
jgi:hypothetical protein